MPDLLLLIAGASVIKMNCRIKNIFLTQHSSITFINRQSSIVNPPPLPSYQHFLNDILNILLKKKDQSIK